MSQSIPPPGRIQPTDELIAQDVALAQAWLAWQDIADAVCLLESRLTRHLVTPHGQLMKSDLRKFWAAAELLERNLDAALTPAARAALDADQDDAGR